MPEDNIPTREDDGLEESDSKSVSDEFAHDSDSEKESKTRKLSKNKSSPNRADLMQTLSQNMQAEELDNEMK